jgi:thioredoxin reductase
MLELVKAAAWDVVIVGAGPAGLSAALVLGRCRRRVLLTDSGTPRSAAAHRLHGFLSRDGIDLGQFRASCREQLRPYPNVTLCDLEVRDIAGDMNSNFTICLADGTAQHARTVLLASGVFDELPAIPNIERFFGKTVHPCPYCEGWEMKDLPIAVYGKGSRGFEMARAMTAWSTDILLCTNGPAELTRNQERDLLANGIEIETAKIAELVGDGGELGLIRFETGAQRTRRALFFDTPCHPQSILAQKLGCQMTGSNSIRCGAYAATSVAGIYAAGNILQDVHLSIVAAGDGARAAFGINRTLTRQDFAMRAFQGRKRGCHQKRGEEKPAMNSSAVEQSRETALVESS